MTGRRRALDTRADIQRPVKNVGQSSPEVLLFVPSFFFFFFLFPSSPSLPFSFAANSPHASRAWIPRAPLPPPSPWPFLPPRLPDSRSPGNDGHRGAEEKRKRATCITTEGRAYNVIYFYHASLSLSLFSLSTGMRTHPPTPQSFPRAPSSSPVEPPYADPHPYFPNHIYICARIFCGIYHGGLPC